MESGDKQPVLACEEAVNAYLKDVDRTLIREQLKRSPEERAITIYRFSRFLDATRGLARKAKPSPRTS